jgi:hypothetical protein
MHDRDDFYAIITDTVYDTIGKAQYPTFPYFSFDATIDQWVSPYSGNRVVQRFQKAHLKIRLLLFIERSRLIGLCKRFRMKPAGFHEYFF